MITLELLRPNWLLRDHGLTVGTEFEFSMTEIASKGKGTVVEVGPCPEIADGEGEVVIGRFVTARSLEVVRLTMPEGTTLTGTRVHPIWSVDRHDWVRMDELQVGEHLQTRLGPMPIASIEQLIDPQPVYNLEINGQHAYEVTELGILVHNNLWCELNRLRNLEGPLSPAELAELNRLERMFSAPIKGFDFGKHLRGFIGDPPKGMIDPHAHHILFKKGLGPDQQALVIEGQAILRKVGIDPIYGRENLVWAPWRVHQQHHIDTLTHVVNKLRELDAIGGDYDDFVRLLKELGEAAARRS